MSYDKTTGIFAESGRTVHNRSFFPGGISYAGIFVGNGAEDAWDQTFGRGGASCGGSCFYAVFMAVFACQG